MRKLEFFSDQNNILNQSECIQRSSRNNLSMMNKTMDDHGLGDSECKYYQKDLREAFEKEIPIKVKGYDREEYQTTLVIKIQWTVPSHQHSQILHLEITDPSNNQYLYTLDIPEADFIKLKNDQHLMMDYQMFPKKLIEILEFCIDKQDQMHFACILDHKNKNEAVLCIVEMNQFRMLQHLALTFRFATDDIVKKYLSHKLSVEKMNHNELKKNHENLQEAFASKQHETEILMHEAQRLKDEKDKIIDNIVQNERQRINDLVEKNLQKEADFQTKFNQEKSQMILKYETNIETILQKLEQSQQQNLNYQENLLNKESQIRDYEQKQKLMEKDNFFYKQEIEKCKQDINNLNEKVYDLEKANQQYNLKNASLQQQLDDKIEIIQKNGNIINGGEERFKMINESFDNIKKQKEKLEKKLKLCTDEITKGNEIIGKLQEENESKKQKLKQKNNILLQQEQHNTKIQDLLQEMRKSENEQKRLLDEKDLQLKELQIQIKDQKQKLDESLNLIESNNKMIQYLNQQLNETQKPTIKAQTNYTAKFTPINQAKFEYNSKFSPITQIDKSSFDKISYDKPNFEKTNYDKSQMSYDKNNFDKNNFNNYEKTDNFKFNDMNQKYDMNFTGFANDIKTEKSVSDKNDDLDQYLQPRSIQPIKYKGVQKLD